MSYDTIHFPFQVHDGAVDTETAYLSPEHLPFGTRLEVTPAQADIAPDTAAVFQCTLTIDDQISSPGATTTRDSCSPRGGSRTTPMSGGGAASTGCVRACAPASSSSAASGTPATTASTGCSRWTPIRTSPSAVSCRSPWRLRVEVDDGGEPDVRWHVLPVQPGGGFSLHLDLDGKGGATATAEAWFDRTELLASARSKPRVSVHQLAPVIG